MIVTREWIEAHRTPRGGWTRKQLAAIAIGWPPAGGWIDRAVGLEIDATAQAIFESATGGRPQSNRTNNQVLYELAVNVCRAHVRCIGLKDQSRARDEAIDQLLAHLEHVTPGVVLRSSIKSRNKA